MQVKKKQIRDGIVEAALQEFKNNGFSEASMNSIAGRAGMSKGAIYAYFASKEELFYTCVEPAIKEIEKTLDIENVNKKGMDDEEASVVEFGLTVMKEHDSFRLLLFNSGGSKYENYKEEIIQMYTKSLAGWWREFEHKSQDILEVKSTQMFMHSMAGLFVSYIEEIVIHSPDEEDIASYAKNMADFIKRGLPSVL